MQPSRPLRTAVRCSRVPPLAARAQVLRGIEAVARLKEAEGGPPSPSELEQLTEELKEAEAAWRPLAEHALRQLPPTRDVPGGAARGAAARERRRAFADLQRQQKRKWLEDEYRRRTNEAQQTKHEKAMAQWRRSQKIKAKVERWHAQMWAESGVDAPPPVAKTPQLRPRRPPPTLGSPDHRKPPAAPIRLGAD
jgi:hypothetical protein